jgi:hypothetical protein
MASKPCPNCGSRMAVDAVANDGTPYKGCPDCIVTAATSPSPPSVDALMAEVTYDLSDTTERRMVECDEDKLRDVLARLIEGNDGNG